MLNYVWLGLIMLGLAAAVYNDVTDSATDKYRNNENFPVIIRSDSPVKAQAGKKEVTVIIPPEDFSGFYGEEQKDTLKFPATLTINPNGKMAAFLFTVDKGFPEVWRTMAGVSGEENDLAGKVYFSTDEQGYITGAEMVFEETSLVKLRDVVNGALNYAGIAVDIVIGLIGIMALWLGIMKIAEEAGLINYIAKAARPITRLLFPEIPHDHPAIGSMIMNISATFLGLGNAATPFGIKAMEDLNKLNPNKGTATNAMCTFLVINTASFALMPTTAIALRAAAGSSNPAIIIGTTMFGSFTATVVGLTAAKILEKFPIRFGELGAWLKNHAKFLFTVVVALAVMTLFFVTGLASSVGNLLSFIDLDILRTVIEYIAIVAIPLLIFVFVLMGAIKKVKIYETFVDGAKEGFEVAVTIIPYLVAILVGIGIFRAGGAMEWLVTILKPVTDFIGMPAEALPMALMRPLSGSGSLGIMAEIIATHGPDSFIGILVSTFFGSTETTFYVIAVYFGAVNIRNTRHALPAGLISDAAGILAAIFIVRLLFG